jgi:hypothetical protein
LTNNFRNHVTSLLVTPRAASPAPHGERREKRQVGCMTNN